MRILTPLLLTAFIFLSGCLSSSNTIHPTSSLPKPTFYPGKSDAYPIPLLMDPTAETAHEYPNIPLEITTPNPYPGMSDGYPVSLPSGMPTLVEKPTATISPSKTPTPTITPTLTSTATLPPYTGKPFSIVFIRDGNLWLAEIGGKGEHQLTHEPEGWWVYRFDVNQQGDQIAYVALKGQFPDVINGMIKQFDLQTGEVRPSIGEGDQLVEDRVKWLDDTHLAYVYTKWPAHDTDTPAEPLTFWEYHPDNYFVVDLKIGTKRYFPDTIDISQSPDGRYLVTCIGNPYASSCRFQLHDLRTNQTQAVAEDSDSGWFNGWSSDSKWMLFANKIYGHTETDQKYLMVNSVSRLGNWVVFPGQSWGSTSWAFHRAVVACAVCESENNCQIRFWGPDGNQTKPPISLPQPFRIISWTPDDTRLLLAQEDHTLWIINMDGTGLSRILNNVEDWAVLAKK